jgi:hypothetical protein
LGASAGGLRGRSAIKAGTPAEVPKAQLRSPSVKGAFSQKLDPTPI